jgi:hypothetical protein
MCLCPTHNQIETTKIHDFSPTHQASLHCTILNLQIGTRTVIHATPYEYIARVKSTFNGFGYDFHYLLPSIFNISLQLQFFFYPHKISENIGSLSSLLLFNLYLIKLLLRHPRHSKRVAHRIQTKHLILYKPATILLV